MIIITESRVKRETNSIETISKHYQGGVTKCKGRIVGEASFDEYIQHAVTEHGISFAEIDLNVGPYFYKVAVD